MHVTPVPQSSLEKHGTTDSSSASLLVVSVVLVVVVSVVPLTVSAMSV
jgi:hypothetical protein